MCCRLKAATSCGAATAAPGSAKEAVDAEAANATSVARASSWSTSVVQGMNGLKTAASCTHSAVPGDEGVEEASGGAPGVFTRIKNSTTCSSATGAERTDGVDSSTSTDTHTIGLMTRMKNAASCASCGQHDPFVTPATCSASEGAMHEMQQGVQHDAANADGMTLSQRLSCYGARHKGTAGSGNVADHSKDAASRAGVVHGAVETVLEKMKTDHAASVVAINGQKLAEHDLKALMQALSSSWEKGSHLRGAQSCVRKLYLGQDDISDEGASCIAECLKGQCQLSELRLHDNKISDAGAAALASALQGNARICVLVLGHNQIKELGGASLGLMLRFNSSITDLDVSANDLGDHGVKLLAECLPSNRALRNLHLARNRVGAAGVTGLCEALERGCGLQRINLGSNPLGASGARVLAAALENEKVQLTHLHLGATNLGDAGA